MSEPLDYDSTPPEKPRKWRKLVTAAIITAAGVGTVKKVQKDLEDPFSLESYAVKCLRNGKVITQEDQRHYVPSQQFAEVFSKYIPGFDVEAEIKADHFMYDAYDAFRKLPLDKAVPLLYDCEQLPEMQIPIRKSADTTLKDMQIETDQLMVHEFKRILATKKSIDAVQYGAGREEVDIKRLLPDGVSLNTNMENEADDIIRHKMSPPGRLALKTRIDGILSTAKVNNPDLKTVIGLITEPLNRAIELDKATVLRESIKR